MCAALAAIACLIVEYGYEKNHPAERLSVDVSLDADGSIDRGSGFYGACGALSASGVGQKGK